MAGSKRTFQYIGDNGTAYAIVADESNVEAVNGAAAAVPAVAARSRVFQPQSSKLRYAVYGNAAGRRIKIPMLTAALYNAVDTASPTIPDPLGAAGAVLSFIDRTPERFKSPKWIDTGLTDGDVEGV
jgi:hypothetical protein